MSDFSEQEKATIYRLIGMRRDMRHFLPDPLDAALLQRLLAAAHQAPSVGLMQPWRFIRIQDRSLREKIHALVEVERVQTAKALGEREDEFMHLKVQGILECGEVMVAALAPGREGHIFGRRTMPDMDLASVSCAIQNLWLPRALKMWAWDGYRFSIPRPCVNSSTCRKEAGRSRFSAWVTSLNSILGPCSRKRAGLNAPISTSSCTSISGGRVPPSNGRHPS